MRGPQCGCASHTLTHRGVGPVTGTHAEAASCFHLSTCVPGHKATPRASPTGGRPVGHPPAIGVTLRPARAELLVGTPGLGPRPQLPPVSTPSVGVSPPHAVCLCVQTRCFRSGRADTFWGTRWTPQPEPGFLGGGSGNPLDSGAGGSETVPAWCEVGG